MKRLLLGILIISIALISACAVSADDADNIDLKDSDIDSGLLLANNSIQSNPQELGNESVDTENYDDDSYMQSEKNATPYFNKDIDQKEWDKIFPSNRKEEIKDFDISSKRHVIRDILKGISLDDYQKMPPLDNLSAYSNWEEMSAILSQLSSPNQ